MADSGALEVGDELAGVVQAGESGLEMGVLVRSEGGEPDSPKIRRSARKKPLKSLTNRGRLLKSRPKSPLMRMVEMRKGGLRGRDLRHSGLKGVEGSVSKSSKGPKGMVGKDSLGLEATLACSEAGDGLKERLGEENRSADVGVSGLGSDAMVEDCNAAGFMDNPIQMEPIPAGITSDLALDLMSAQPLQDMMFVGEQVAAVFADVGSSEKNPLLVEIHSVEEVRGNVQVSDIGMDEEFPQLSKENLRNANEKGKNKGGGGKGTTDQREPGKDQRGIFWGPKL